MLAGAGTELFDVVLRTDGLGTFADEIKNCVRVCLGGKERLYVLPRGRHRLVPRPGWNWMVLGHRLHLGGKRGGVCRQRHVQWTEWCVRLVGRFVPEQVRNGGKRGARVRAPLAHAHIPQTAGSDGMRPRGCGLRGSLLFNLHAFAYGHRRDYQAEQTAQTECRKELAPAGMPVPITGALSFHALSLSPGWDRNRCSFLNCSPVQFGLVKTVLLP